MKKPAQNASNFKYISFNSWHSLKLVIKNRRSVPLMEDKVAWKQGTIYLKKVVRRVALHMMHIEKVENIATTPQNRSSRMLSKYSKYCIFKCGSISSTHLFPSSLILSTVTFIHFKNIFLHFDLFAYLFLW